MTNNLYLLCLELSYKRWKKEVSEHRAHRARVLIKELTFDFTKSNVKSDIHQWSANHKYKISL